MTTLRDKFEASVSTSDTGCLEWTRAVNAYGYGVVRDDNSKTKLAHRAAWFLAYGAYPKKHLLHTCDNPKCVRLDHLFEGSQADNMADKMQKGRHKWGNRKWAPNEPKPWSKLTLEQVLAIKSADGPQTRIAAQYGISQKTVSDIKRGRRWPHAEIAA
jgi:hypothetical protein